MLKKTEWNPKIIALTGASGWVGTELRAAYPEVEWRCYPGRMENPTDLRAWVRSLAESPVPVDGLIHLAAVVPVDRVERDPVQARLINFTGTQFLADAILETPQKFRPWLFYASSSHVYAPSDYPLIEESLVQPRSTYGKTKWEGEEAWLRLQDSQRFTVCSGRIFSITGPHQPGSFLIPALINKIRNARANEVLKIQNYRGSRDFLSLREAVRAIMHLGKVNANGAVNIGSGESWPISEMIGMMVHKLARTDLRIEAANEETSRMTADVTQLRALGFFPTVDHFALLERSADRGAGL